MATANRSRTENWKTCLEQIAARGGSLEIAVRVDHLLNPGSDLIWRVRLLQVNPKEVVVEHPAAVGRSFKLSLHTDLVVGMTIGQNRWMFSTRVMGARVVKMANGRDTAGLLIALPERVERCSRRAFYRVGTAEFNLPQVECWPLLDPASVLPAETANRVHIQELLAATPKLENAGPAQVAPSAPDSPAALPAVGPKFHARLLNISGGGLGLVIDPKYQAMVERHSFLWVRVNLGPQIPVPVAMTVRRCHTHTDASQQLYGGFTFDFTFHQAHQKFIVDLFTRYVEMIEQKQRTQKAKQTEAA